jgi:import inner membrane translocase subunit TIM16
MSGPVAKMVIQAVILGVSILSRALPAAYAAALQNAKKSGASAATDSASVMGRKMISRDEALLVLNLREAKVVTPEAIQKVRMNEIHDCLGYHMDGLLRQVCSLHILTLFMYVVLIYCEQQYDKYFESNSVEKGGSFYLQSKIYRAKEMLDEYEKEKRMEAKQEAKQQQKGSGQ